MKKSFLQPKVEFIYFNDNIILMSITDVDNVENFPEAPNQEGVNVDFKS